VTHGHSLLREKVEQDPPHIGIDESLLGRSLPVSLQCLTQPAAEGCAPGIGRAPGGRNGLWVLPRSASGARRVVSSSGESV
jgi:hypothetical protein